MDLHEIKQKRRQEQDEFINSLKHNVERDREFKEELDKKKKVQDRDLITYK